MVGYKALDSESRGCSSLFPPPQGGGIRVVDSVSSPLDETKNRGPMCYKCGHVITTPRLVYRTNKRCPGKKSAEIPRTLGIHSDCVYPESVLKGIESEPCATLLQLAFPDDFSTRPLSRKVRRPEFPMGTVLTGKIN